ncbi:MAG TPA: peptidylprolyl isomerase [Methylocystis sp.]|nr:peptidylprolyl isomerase [Methylocystis sp.]
MSRHAILIARGRRAVFGGVALCALLAGVGAPAQAKVLAKVNNVEITDDDLKLATEDIAPSIPRQLEGKARDSYVLDYLIDEQLLVQEAQAQKLAETPDFAKRLAYLRDKALFETLLGKVAKDATSDANIKQTYDTVAKAQKPDTEYHAHHILVPTEDEAKAVYKRVKGGEDFAKVADETSKDPGSKGGDLGWFTKDKMVPEFGDAAAKLEPGQLSEPVKSSFGWHVIRLDEKRPKVFPPLDQIRPQVERYVAQKATADFVGKLREAAKIERAEPPTPPSGAAPTPAPTPAPAKGADKKK